MATGGYASGLRSEKLMHKMDTNGDGMVSIGSKNGNGKKGEQSGGDGRRESVKSKTSTYQIKMIKPNTVTRFVDGRELKNGERRGGE